MLLPEFIYYCGYLLKRNLDIKSQRALPQFVISIGNLTAGGTGKTPATIAMAEEAKKRGYSPVILTRGYKGTNKGPCFVSKGEGPLASPDEAGDEAFLMAQRLRGVPVVKAHDRYEGGLFAINNGVPQKSKIFWDAHNLDNNKGVVFILDDGFQHLRLFRNIDILLIDGMNPFGNRRLLPLGRLREPVREMKRADIIVITRSHSIPESLVKEIRRYNDRATIFSSDHRPAFFRTINGMVIPLKDLSGKSAIAFCGIGNPDSFKKTITDLGIDLRDFIVFRDHHRFNLHDLKRIERVAERSKADWIITTEKDIIRLGNLTSNLNYQDRLLCLSIEFEIEEKFYEEVFNRL